MGCIFVGCTDSTAENYMPSATVDSGRCISSTHLPVPYQPNSSPQIAAMMPPMVESLAFDANQLLPHPISYHQPAKPKLVVQSNENTGGNITAMHILGGGVTVMIMFLLAAAARYLKQKRATILALPSTSHDWQRAEASNAEFDSADGITNTSITRLVSRISDVDPSVQRFGMEPLEFASGSKMRPQQRVPYAMNYPEPDDDY